MLTFTAIDTSTRPGRTATDAETRLATKAGRDAATAGESRAPGINATVLSLIGDAPVGEPRTTAIMLAFQSGYDEAATDTHGNTRASQFALATQAIAEADFAIADAMADGADGYDPEAMRRANDEVEAARVYRDAITLADLDGLADATPTTYADLAREAAGRAEDAAREALDGN
jgi:hypothetical protein